MKDSVKEYSDIIKKIRALSTPNIDNIKNEQDYSKILIVNFLEIQTLSEQSNNILNKELYPLINKEENLTKEEINILRDYSSIFFNSKSMESIDLFLGYKTNKRLLNEARKQDDVVLIIEYLDSMVEICFALMHSTQRLSSINNTCYKYRDEGLDAAFELLKYLPEEKFKTLPNEKVKHTILINSRYISALFDRSDNYCDEINEFDLDILKKSLKLCENEFYLKECPNYDWKTHRFRTLQYISDFLELNNVRKCSQDMLEEIFKYTREFVDLYKSDTDYYGESMDPEVVERYLYRASYLTNNITVDEYKGILSKHLLKRRSNDGSFRDNIRFVHGLSEYLNILRNSNLTIDEKNNLKKLYVMLIKYVQKASKLGSISFLLTFLSNVLQLYIEIDGYAFDEFCLGIMAAIHPITYIHSLDVSDISVYLAKCLLDKEPKRFIGVNEYKSEEEVIQNNDKIIDYVKRAALCHDFGKLMIMETVMTYWRSLVEGEIDLIKTHPLIGAHLLGMYSTKKYVNIAKYHHTEYNSQNGYPIEDTSRLLDKTILDIISVADCIDAATDRIGRCFKSGKTIKEVTNELKKGKGNKYASYVVELLEDKKIFEELKKIVREERNKNYRNAYSILANK